MFFGWLLGFWLSANTVTAQLAGQTGTPQENTAKPMRIRLAADVPRAITQNMPVYPQSAIDQGVKDKVVLHLIIATDGRVKEVSVWSGPAVLADSAMETVKGWRYEPSRLNGGTVEVDTTVTLNFVLDPSPRVTVDNSPLLTSSSQGNAPCIGRRLPPPAADADVAATASMRGQIRDGSYENSYFGLNYVPDAKLIFNTSTFFAGNVQTLSSFGLFSAWAEEQVGRARLGTIAYAERLLNYPEGCRNTENILWRYVQNQLGDGYQVVSERKPRQLRNISFLEADFRRGGISQAILLASRKGYVLVFVFTASNPTELDTLVSSSRIALVDHTED